jgi:hypothetical protein
MQQFLLSAQRIRRLFVSPLMQYAITDIMQAKSPKAMESFGDKKAKI